MYKKLICFKILLVLSLFSGCVSDVPWKTHKMIQSPDRSCFVGPSEQGCEVYIWNCLNNEKIVIYQCGSAFMMPNASRESVDCKSQAPFEKKYYASLKECASTPRKWNSDK
ncbi:hypothetical protein K2P97_12575 [bacterium]|nr:hypothetical protein [bacterium]